MRKKTKKQIGQFIYEIPKKRYFTPVIRGVAKSQMVLSFPSDLQNYFMKSTYQSLYLMVKVDEQ